MADTFREAVFQRLRGWVSSSLDPQGQVSGPGPYLFPPPPGQTAFPQPPKRPASSLGFTGQITPAAIQLPSTDIPRAPNFQPYHDYNRAASARALDWVWQDLTRFLPSTDVPRSPNFQPYNKWNRLSAANAQFWVQSGIRAFVPPWFQVFTG